MQFVFFFRIMGLDRVVLRLSTLVQASLDLGRHVSSSPVDCCQLHVAGSELSLSKLPVRILAVIAFFVRSLACTDGKWQCGVVWPLSWSRMKCPTRAVLVSAEERHCAGPFK